MSFPPTVVRAISRTSLVVRNSFGATTTPTYPVEITGLNGQHVRCSKGPYQWNWVWQVALNLNVVLRVMTGGVTTINRNAP